MTFSVRVIHKAETAGVPIRWANTWEVQAELGGATTNFQTLAGFFATFHRQVLLRNFYVESVVVSTLAVDGEPYNPVTFGVLEVNQRGLGGDTGTDETVLPIVNCLLVKKQVPNGRNGNLLLRGYLTEAQIRSDPASGAITLVDQTGIQNQIQNAYTALQAGVLPIGTVAMIGSGLAAAPRAVSSLFVKGVTQKSLNNKYFDRTNSGIVGTFEQMANALRGATGLANTIVQAYNALPTPDLPLLPE